ncbi:hypothetical protein GOV06_00695 [Candidatus Woesearchaeota archaeon]|nr:hypothetical protein [Candidatus Woesearchaeota archaeon]
MDLIKKPKTKAQFSIQFAWIFILIAGAIILIFFISLVYKQKEISEIKLSATVLSQIETILTGAGLSPGTVNLIDMPETQMNFICDAEGFSEFSIKGTSLTKATPVQVVFAPDTVQGKRLITWALSWDTPFKVTNFLYLSDLNTKYILINPNYEVEKDFPEEFEPSIKSSLDGIQTKGLNKIRIVYFNSQPDMLPEQMQSRNLDVSAIQVTPGTVSFYKRTKDRQGFELEGSIPYIDMPSLYGAIFSQDLTFYECNMKKAFKHLNHVSEIYAARESSIEDYFLTHPTVQDCHIYYHNKIQDLVSDSANCSQDIRLCISSIDVGAIKDNQETLIRKSCPLIY